LPQLCKRIDKTSAIGLLRNPKHRWCHPSVRTIRAGSTDAPPEQGTLSALFISRTESQDSLFLPPSAELQKDCIPRLQ